MGGDDHVGEGQQPGQDVVLQRQVGLVLEEQGGFFFIHVQAQVAELAVFQCVDQCRSVHQGAAASVDQHAAHERVAYERLMRAWKSQGSIETQRLLIPMIIEIEAEHVDAIIQHADELVKIGLEVERMGPTQIAVAALPVLLKESTVEQSLRELAKGVVERGGSHVFEERVGDIFASMACHSVVRAGQALSIEQMRSLLEQMDEFPLSGFCPHGRPVSVEYMFTQLERDFGRTV